MNKKQYMWARLIMPAIAIIFGIVSNDTMILAFAAGYFLCWIFSWNLVDKIKGEKNE